MIKVKTTLCDNKFVGIEIKGHANFAKKGSDIVCAGVSALGFALVGTLKSLNVPLTKESTKNKIHILLDVDNANEVQKSTVNLLILQTVIGIEQIKQQYKQYFN